MDWRIEVKMRKEVFDAEGESVHKSLQDLGVKAIAGVDVVQVYSLNGDINNDQVDRIASLLLANPVTQEYGFHSLTESIKRIDNNGAHAIEIAYNPGVMDPVEHSTLKGINDLGINGVTGVKTGKKYIFHGDVDPQELRALSEKVLFNKLIQHVVDQKTSAKPVAATLSKGVKLILVDLIKANDKQLLNISRQGQLFLNINEMKAIRAHFRSLKRNPTDCELETIAQTWSEHCYHKTFRGDIEYTYVDKGKSTKTRIRSLLKSTIVKATTQINKPWCVSVFHDNAGVIKFDNESHVCFKVETHNHPSALEPYGGANTGVGGVIRDILGTGLGAKPVCNTDVFCFARPDTRADTLPVGTLHPKRVMKGVVSGVRDYGNKMGIPTINGSILFDKHFIGNPLVYCGCVGIIPKNRVAKKARKGDKIIVVGGRTGRDGIHGATFSSGELTTDSEVVSSGAVQIGDPIQEKKVLDALMIARDKGLYDCITDCGAGGLSSSVGEMGQELGARVQLEKVPLKYAGLKYMEVWISESQERMVLSVPPDNVKELLSVFQGENVEATVIGEFTGRKRLELFYDDCQVADLDMEFLHKGNPKIAKKARWVMARKSSLSLPSQIDLAQKLKEVLGHLNVCSKEWVIRQYDHEVQGASVIKPLVGVACDGPSDASVIAPKLGSTRGIAVANGINIRFGMIDPYWMAASCIDEAIRQIVAVGGDPERIAILDNFCWGNPDKPDRLGSLVRAAQGCYKTAVGYKTPFISGKDSLYNEYTEGKKSIAIPGTILISSVGIIEDVTKTVTMDFKQSGNYIYLLGETFNELGGSIYLDTLGMLGSDVPQVSTLQGIKIFKALHRAIRKGWVKAAHDCSEGGLGVCLAEMAFSGNLGLSVFLDQVLYQGKTRRDDIVLFSESNSRFVVEVDARHQKAFENLMKGVPSRCIGLIEDNPRVLVHGLNKEICLNSDLQELKEAWASPLRW